jgi:hypothetical protein
MVSNDFKECLLDVYQGEQTGEVAFELMLHGAEDNEQRYILGSLMQLETEGKAIIRPILLKCGLSMLDIPDSRSNGANAANQMNQMPWAERFAATAELVKSNFLPRYEELATLVSLEEDPDAFKVANFMGDHERALIATSEKIALGDANPTAPVVELLHFPLKRAADD